MASRALRYLSPSYSYASPLSRWLEARGVEVVEDEPRMAKLLLETSRVDAAMTPITLIVL